MIDFILNMETKKKLYLKAVVWFLFLAAILSVAYQKTAGMRERILSTYHENIVSGQQILEIKADMNGVRALLCGALDESSSIKLDDSVSRIKTVSNRIDERFDLLLKNRYIAGAEMPEQITAIRDIWTAFRETRDRELIPYIYAGNYVKARELAYGVQAERYRRFIEMADALVKKESEEGYGKLDETASLIHNMRNGFIFLFIFLVIAHLVMNNIMIRMMIEPMSRGVNMAEAIAGGNVDEKIDGKYLRRGDEVGMLMKSLDRMSASLNRFSNSVSNSSAKLISSSQQLSALSDEITRGTETQSQRASQVATATEEMSSTVSAVAINASQVSQAARDADEAARKGGVVVTRTVDSMNSILSSVKNSSGAIIKLGNRSNEIGQIVSVIDEIADQTNLLALNAAIEAARAGEQGRGFAVVADEVRKLAERTSRATKEISGMISAIQEETRTAVSTMEAGTREVETGVTLAGEAGKALDEIVDSVDKVSAMVRQITVAADEQSKAADEISRDIEEVADVTRHTSVRAKEIASAVHDLTALAGELKGVVSSFKVSIALKWSDSLLTGNDKIDEQHRELFARINMLTDAVNQSKGSAAVRETVAFLQDYVVMHFGTEEKLMKELNYPPFESHKAQHVEFVRVFLDIKDKLERNDYRFGPDTVELADLEQFIGDWLINHIKKLDKALAEFVKKKGRSR